MSIRIMSQVWDLELPPVDKLVLLALADASNDGGQCFPSVATLMRKASLTTDRGVQKILQRLEAAGLLAREYRLGRSTVYHVTPPPNGGSPPNHRSPPNGHSPHPRTTVHP